jgi:hypothetical protein
MLLVPFLGVDLTAISYPDFFGLAKQRVRLAIEERNLGRNFARQPNIIGVQKCDKGTCSPGNARVSSSTHPSMVLSHDHDLWIAFEDFRSIVD